jgi:hypothetical protein
MNLYRKRNELRKVFDRIVSRMNWDLADIEKVYEWEEGTGFAEQKRRLRAFCTLKVTAAEPVSLSPKKPLN